MCLDFLNTASLDLDYRNLNASSLKWESVGSENGVFMDNVNSLYDTDRLTLCFNSDATRRAINFNIQKSVRPNMTLETWVYARTIPNNLFCNLNKKKTTPCFCFFVFSFFVAKK